MRERVLAVTVSTGSVGENLPAALEHIRDSYRDRAPGPRVDRWPVTRDARRLAAFVALGLDEPSAVRDLAEVAGALREHTDLPSLLSQAVAGATALLGTRMSNLQLVDPRDGSLVLVTQTGFDADFLDHFSVVADQSSVCGLAARQGAQVVASDVRDDPTFAPHRAVLRAAGVRAVQSTPLTDAAGRMIGMISTHTPHPGRPSPRELATMQLYCMLAGEAIARSLGRPAATGDPDDPLPEEPFREPAMGRFMADTVSGLFAAGLGLAVARQVVTDQFAARRIQEGLDTLDATIHSIQRAVLEFLFVDGLGRS